MKKWGIKPFILGLVGLSLLHFIFALRTNTFFSIDDFFEIQYFRDNSLLGIIPEFIIYGDINEFRRVVGFLAFGGLFKMFGTNHLAFDLAMFMTNTINLILLFLVVRKITKNDFGAFFVSVIFNKNYLYYYSNIHEHLLATFCILTIFFFLYYPKKFYLSVISFMLAVFTKETAVTVPLVLYAISLFYGRGEMSSGGRQKLDRKNIFYLFLISAAFGIYASYFFVLKKILGQNSVYMPAVKIVDLFRGYLFFVNYAVIALCIALPVFFKKYKYLPLLVTVFVTLTPAAMLVNRRESYYLYMPFLYLMIYISLFLPKVGFKDSLLYLVIFFVFGGRSIFPSIARQVFPNWQKVSIQNVLNRVQDKAGMEKSIYIGDIYLERDAQLMLRSGTTDLFLPEDIGGKYNFIYDPNSSKIEVVPK